MRKIVLAAAVMGVFALSACGEKKAEQVTAPAPTPTVAPLSDADKASIDELGGDVAKLAEVFASAEGTKRDYAEEQLINAIRKSSDAALMEKLSSTIPGPSRPQMEAKIRMNILNRTK